MSLLRAQCAARLLPTVSSSSRVAVSCQRRYDSTFTSDQTIKPPPGRVGDVNKPNTEMMKRTVGEDSLVSREDLDYGARVDHGTSQFSPVPKRVVDGSEETGSLAAAVLSGAPIDLQARQVRIFRPTKTATQSGDWHSHAWQMDWDVMSHGHRWENPLMGWQSSGDFMQGTRLSFKSRDDAIRFAEKQGYEYFVQEPNERRFTPKAYANNFMHSPKKLKKIPTK